MILIAIVDGHQQERKTLEEFVAHSLNEKNIAHLIHKFDSGVEFIRSRTLYEIVFMDIQMADMDGLDAARFLRIVNKDAKLIFVTHLAQLAIRGYEVDAMDFLVKPIDRFTIERVLERALSCIEKDCGSYFLLKTPQSIISLPTRIIYYVEVYDHDLVYHTEQGDYRARGRLSDVREKFNGLFFVQCSRSHLVNMCHVQSLHNDHLMINGTKVQITKSHRKEIEQMFIDYQSRRTKGL